MRWIVGSLLALILFASTATAAAPPRYNGITLKPDQAGAVRVIRHVFGPYANEALAVSYCESRFWVWASNGQYQGLFQMGSSERARYGHSYNNAWVQARAARRYFIASGRDWSPWSCKP